MTNQVSQRFAKPPSEKTSEFESPTLRFLEWGRGKKKIKRIVWPKESLTETIQ